MGRRLGGDWELFQQWEGSRSCRKQRWLGRKYKILLTFSSSHWWERECPRVLEVAELNSTGHWTCEIDISLFITYIHSPGKEDTKHHATSHWAAFRSRVNKWGVWVVGFVVTRRWGFHGRMLLANNSTDCRVSPLGWGRVRCNWSSW